MRLMDMTHIQGKGKKIFLRLGVSLDVELSVISMNYIGFPWKLTILLVSKWIQKGSIIV